MCIRDRREADAVVRRAEDRARALIAQEEIIKQAQQKAAEILSQAQTKACLLYTSRGPDPLLRAW